MGLLEYFKLKLNYYFEQRTGKKLRKKENVIGHHKTLDGKFEVFVTKKYRKGHAERLAHDPRYSFTEKDIVPSEVRVGLKKLPTRVTEVGEVEAQTTLKGGDKIQPNPGYWYGTGGGFATRTGVKLRGSWRELTGVPDWMKEKLANDSRTNVYLLTNRHVVLKDYFDEDSAEDMYLGSYFIGGIEKIGPKHLDYALIRCTIANNYPDVREVGLVVDSEDPEVGMALEKYGARTNHTEGSVLRTGVTLDVHMGDGKYQLFTDMVMCSKMSDRGDSGSYLVWKDHGVVVALLNSGSASYTFGIPIRKVFKDAKVMV